MALNRKTSPALSALFTPSLLPYSRKTLSNGIELITMQAPTQEVFKLDIIFDAGIVYQPHPLIASSTLELMNEGTSKHTSAEIAELFDYYGAGIDFSCGMHKAEVTLLSLNKYAGKTIDMMAETITESIFPKKEIEIYLRNKRQDYLTEREKTSWLARKELFRTIFGESHPYANPLKESDFGNVRADDLRKFYREHINTFNCRLVLSGNITPEIQERAEQAFCALHSPATPRATPEYHLSSRKPGRYHVTKKGAVQTSIRIGKEGLRLTDEDYADFQLLNTVLGGYFGSRLMSNIREEKGYTYGINSFNVSLPLAGLWCIGTDVNQKHTEATITETLKEIRTLQTELVTEDELSLVKNYIYGDLLRELDGVFAQAEALKHKLIYGTDNRFYLDVIRKIKQCSPEKIRDLANKYMNIDELYIITAGEQ